jgi:hypothetical protein
MSNISKTPALMLPHQTGEITLTKADVEFKDSAATHCWDKFEWNDTDDKSPRVDVRELHSTYSEDHLYTPVDTCGISLTFTAETDECLIDPDEEFFPLLKIVSTASKFQIVKKGETYKRGTHNITMNVQLTRTQFLKLKGLIVCQIGLIKSGDGTSVGTLPVKTTSGVYATSDGAILATSELESNLQIVLDDTSAPTSSGMELEWIDMTDTPDAQYALNYLKCDDPEEKNFRITLQLNEKSHLYTLRNALGGRKRDLKKVVISQISSAVTMNLLYDLCNKFETFIQGAIDGTTTPEDDSLLEFCISVLTGVAKSVTMDYEEIFSTFVGDMEKIRDIALKIQNSKEMENMLTKLVSTF